MFCEWSLHPLRGRVGLGRLDSALTGAPSRGRIPPRQAAQSQSATRAGWRESPQQPLWAQTVGATDALGAMLHRRTPGSLWTRG